MKSLKKTLKKFDLKRHFSFGAGALSLFVVLFAYQNCSSGGGSGGGVTTSAAPQSLLTSGTFASPAGVDVGIVKLISLNPVTVATVYGIQPTGIAAGQIVTGSNVDVLLATPSGVYRVPGNGDGTFQNTNSTFINIATTNADSSIAALPFTTGNLGFVVADSLTNPITFSIESNDGAGNFTTVYTRMGAAGPLTTTVQVADLNGDGQPDVLAQYGQFIVTNISVGGGLYLQGTPLGFGTVPTSVVLGALTSGQAPSLAVVEGADVAIYKNNGSGVFAYAPPLLNNVLSDGTAILGAALGDLRGVGFSDLVVISNPYKLGSSWQFDIDTATGNGDGTFQSGDSVTISLPSSAMNFTKMEIDDLTGTGKKQIVFAYTDASFMHVQACHLNPGNGATILCNDYKVASVSGAQITDFKWVDVNNDGIKDLVVSANQDNVTGNSSFFVLLGQP